MTAIPDPSCTALVPHCVCVRSRFCHIADLDAAFLGAPLSSAAGWVSASSTCARPVPLHSDSTTSSRQRRPLASGSFDCHSATWIPSAASSAYLPVRPQARIGAYINTHTTRLHAPLSDKMQISMDTSSLTTNRCSTDAPCRAFDDVRRCVLRETCLGAETSSGDPMHKPAPCYRTHHWHCTAISFIEAERRLTLSCVSVYGRKRSQEKARNGFC
jgi:hypothetical protein